MADRTGTTQLERRLLTIIPWVLASVTGVVLLTNVPGGAALGAYTSEVLVYAFLTAVALFFASLLTEGELSPAHAIGMIAFLSLPEDALRVTLWGLFLGSLAGGVALVARRRPVAHLPEMRRWRNAIFIAARVTLSYFAAAQVYLSAGGSVPLRDSDLTQPDTVFALVVFGLVYLTLYTAVFVLEVYSDGRLVQNLIRNDLSQIFVVLLLPVPFALLSAQVSGVLSAGAAVISTLGLVLIILGLHALSRSEHRLRRQLNELRTLSVVTQAMRSHLHLDGLLKTIYLQVSHLLDTSNFTVALFNTERNRLEYPLVMQDGHEATEGQTLLHQPTMDSGLIHHVMKTGEALLFNGNVLMRAQANGIDPPPPPSVQSWLGVPLQAGGRSLGVISVFSRETRRRFTQNDLRLLNIIAASASIAIENAQLYHQQRERAEQLAMLNNIASLLSGTLSAETVVDTVISSASALSGSNAVAVYLLWDESEGAPADDSPPLLEAAAVRAAGLSDSFTRHAPPPILLSTDMDVPLHHKLPMAVPDIHSAATAAALRPVLAHESKVSLVELPLFMGETAVGVLAVYFDEHQIFTGERLELLRTFATQAAQAIHNARAYTATDQALSRRVEQLLTLAGIGRLLTSTIDLNRISEIILTYAIEATHTSYGAVALYDQDDGHLRVMAHRGYPDDAFAGGFTVAHTLTDADYDEGQIHRIGDLNEHPDLPVVTPAVRSRLLVLILRGPERIGYLLLESERPHAFAVEDSHFVAQITNQALIAIENAQLFDRITEARDRLQVILDTMEEAILLVDAHGEIALVNPRIAALGLQPGDLLNRLVSDLAAGPADVYARLGFSGADELQAIVDSLQTPGDWEGSSPVTYTLPTPDGQGTRTMQRYVIPVRDAHERFAGALLVYYDKTEEHELQTARDEFSRMIVHDLRSPLTAVTTSMKLLREVVPDDADFYDVVVDTTDASRRAIRKLLARVDSLLDISKMESGRISIETDIAEIATLADSVCVELSPLAHELDITITSELDDSLPLLDIDADKVERLLLNLVDNALKYAPSGSEISIRGWRDQPTGDGAAAATTGRGPAFLRIEVADQGPGVPPEYKDTLFDRFVQVEGRRKVRRGVGLGLTFCKLVTEAHGGRIWIEDNPGGGSIFAFTLPITTGETLPEDTGEYPVTNQD